MSDRPKWDAVVHIEASKYLSSRGVTPEDIARYKIEFVDAATAADRLGLGSGKRERRAECAIWLPGWRAAGTVNEQYGHAVFFIRNPWDGKVERSRLGPWKERHPQEIGFMPFFNGRPWREQPIGSLVIICESWIKALAVTKLGYLAVAMNGVDGWSAGGGRLAGNLCAGFSDPIWRDRQFKVTILTDSFNTQNPDSRRNVAQAKTWLASHLAAKGVVARDAVWFAEMPTNPSGGDWGIDDLIMDPAFGPAEARRIIDRHVPVTLHDSLEMKLQAMNESYCWLNPFGSAFQFSTGKFYPLATLSSALNNVTYMYLDGKGQSKEGKVVDAWMKWPGRNSADDVRLLRTGAKADDD